MKKIKQTLGHLLLATLLFNSTKVMAQKKTIQLIKDEKHAIVQVFIHEKHFTDFFFPDTLEKPVLYPIYASNGIAVTRGFPLMPRVGDATDHPHHIGLWMNYENVNGLDFWNNSFAIPAEKKNGYGKIKFKAITKLNSGNKGELAYTADWINNQKEILMNEKTDFVFSEKNNCWIIDRTTTLTAETLVKFTDAKDGLLGLRVAHELQIPSKETKKYTDSKGIVTTVLANKDSIANGNYLNSNGIEGDSVWSKKATWCLLYGKMGTDTVSIAIIDHPKNIGYPTNWHARGYGLFAVNPLGEKVFTNGKNERNLSLQKGETVTFKYRIIIAADKKRLDKSTIELLQKDFTK